MLRTTIYRRNTTNCVESLTVVASIDHLAAMVQATVDAITLAVQAMVHAIAEVGGGGGRKGEQ